MRAAFQTEIWKCSCNFDSEAAAAGASDSPVLGSNGRFMAYRSWANRVPAGSNGASIYLWDRQTGSNVQRFYRIVARE